MELRHLRYFIAVAEELHFGRAAQRLHMAQQPLSRQIRDLEAELAVQLLQRTKRTIHLTDAGQSFLLEARQILTQVEQAVTLVRRIDRGEAGVLKVGFTGPVLNRMLPNVMGFFQAQFPDIQLNLRRLQTDEQIMALLAGEIHVGFLHPPIYTPDLAYEVIYREPLVAALPENHSLARDAPHPLSIMDLASESFVLFPRRLGPHLYDSIVSFCQCAGFQPTVVQEVFPQQTILGLIAAGVGVGIIHTSAQVIRQQGVVTRPFLESTPVLESAMAWCSDRSLHPAAAQLLKTARQIDH